MSEQQPVSQGVKYASRYSGVTLIEGPKDVIVKDAQVSIAGDNGKIYGPYLVTAHIFGEQPNGTVTAVALKVASERPKRAASTGQAIADVLLTELKQAREDNAKLMAAVLAKLGGK